MDDHYEQKLYKDGYKVIIGTDEAGRGCLAGPVVAAACSVKPNTDPSALRDSALNDSKVLSANTREELYIVIKEMFYVGVGICDAKEIDRINILQASLMAMNKAVAELESDATWSSDCLARSILLIDGNTEIPMYKRKQKAITGGDKNVQCIGAASIIAKVTRDRIMEVYSKKYPQYGFERHKGYPTKMHTQAIRSLGRSPLHRKSFKTPENW